MRKTISGTLIVLSFVVVGCNGPAQHDTASGRTEVTIQAKTDAVADKITNGMINRKYYVRSRTPNLLTFERNANLVTSIFFGSRYDSQPIVRIAYDLISDQEQTRVVMSFAIVTNPGSAFERISRFDRNATTLEWQQWLLTLKQQMEAAGRQEQQAAAPSATVTRD